MMIRSLKNNTTYFKWLCDRVVKLNDQRLISIMEQLYSFEFMGLVPNDDNRVSEGLDLRYFYEYETGEVLKFIERSSPCTLLEMLIALAYRFAFATCELGEEPDVENAFKLFIGNLKLSSNKKQNADIIERFLNRNYLFSGEGGLFPLRYSTQDQREVELWYQMNQFIIENDL